MAPGLGGEPGVVAAGAGLVAGLDSAGAGDPLFFGLDGVGSVGIVCLRFGASGMTKGPFCPQPARAPARYTIKHEVARHFMDFKYTRGALGGSPELLLARPSPMTATFHIGE